MCQFLSAIMTRTGTIFHNPWSDSHSDLIALHDLKEGKPGASNFVRLEFVSQNGNFLNVENYVLSVDETYTPDWFDDNRREQAKKHLSGIVKAMIVTDDRAILLGSAYIIGGSAKIENIKTARVLWIGDSATINYVRDSATIKDVGGSAAIKDVGGSATIKDVGGSATIDYVRDSATIGSTGIYAKIVNDNRINK